MTNFRPVDRATPFLLPPSVEVWLPKAHLARFVVDIVDQLNGPRPPRLSALTRQYRGTGSAPDHPTVPAPPKCTFGGRHDAFPPYGLHEG